MTQTGQDIIWLSQEKFDQLSEELEHLKGPGRQEIIERISAARDEGDLKENGGYHAAKDEQGKIELRIRQVEDILRRAQVGETPADDGVVGPGMKVTIRFEGDSDTETFLLASKEMDDGDLTVYSPQSPMGSAVLGAKKGDSVSYEAPHGKQLTVEVVEAVPYSG